MDNIILFLSCMIELYIFFDFFGSFFTLKQKYQNKWFIICITLVISIGYFIINTFNLSFLNMLTFPFVLFIYASILFACSIREKIIYIIFTCSIFWGCEFLFMILLGLPAYIMQQHSIINISSMPWHVFTLKLLTYIICNIFKQISKKSHKRMDSKVFLCYLCVPVASIGIMFLTYYSGADYNAKLTTKVMLCIYFAIMQLGNIIIFYAFQQYSEQLYNNMQQKLIITDQNMKLEYYTQIQEVNTKYKEFIHNTNHYIKAIGTLIAADQNADALNIISELNIELEKGAGIIYSEHGVLNSILSEKKTIAEKKNVEMDIYVEPGTQFGTATDVDLVTILSNLLDNAIEATIKCENRHSVRVRIYMQNQGNICVIKVTNSFNGELIQNGNTFISTKKENGIHGIGLKSVANTTEKCGGYLECYVEGNEFVAVAMLSHTPKSVNPN